MKLFMMYIFHADVYFRFVTIKRKIGKRRDRIFLAKEYMEKWEDFHPSQAWDVLCDILNVCPSNKNYNFLMKLYTTKRENICEIEKELPLQ